MLLEAVLITALFSAYLTVPSQALKSFRLHLICDVFRASHFGFRHGGGIFHWFELVVCILCWFAGGMWTVCRGYERDKVDFKFDQKSER